LANNVRGNKYVTKKQEADMPTNTAHIYYQEAPNGRYRVWSPDHRHKPYLITEFKTKIAAQRVAQKLNERGYHDQEKYN